MVAKQQALAAQQQKQIEALTTTVQKVSRQLELSKAAPQVVDNNQQSALFSSRINQLLIAV